MSIMDLKKNAPKGEFLAYINKKEAAMLKKAGGSGKLVNGIPSFEPQGMAGQYGMGAGVGADGKTDTQRGSPDPGRKGSTFKTYKGGKYIGVDSKLASKYGKGDVKKAADKAIAKGYNYNSAKGDGFFTRGAIANRNFQQKANLKMIQRRNFLNAKKLEQYVDPFDDYTMDGVKAAIARGYKVDQKRTGLYTTDLDFTGYDSNQLTNPDATNPSLGYDFSDLKEGKKTLTSNKGTSIEKTRPNEYRINSKIPGMLGMIAGKVRPDTQVTAQNTLDQLGLGTILAGDPNLTRQDIIDLGNRGKTPEQINPPSGGDNNQPYLPFDYNTGAATTEAVEPYTNDFDYRFGDNQNVIYDNYGTQGYRTTAADGGIMGTRARRAMGGIMERVDKRQQFFLGGIGKAVGKVVGGVAKAAGKVLSSDIGKAAIIGAGIYYGGGGRMPFTKAFNNAGGFTGGGFGGFSLTGPGSFFSKSNPLLFSGGNFNPLKFAGLTTLGGFLAGPAKPNEDIGMRERGGQLIDPLTGKPNDMAGMRENIELAKLEAGDDPDKLDAIDAKYNNMLNLKYHAGLPDATPYNLYGSRGYRTTGAATGGRIGYSLGDLVGKSAGVFQPTSASMSAGNAPSFEGGTGMGGMIADLIRKNPNMFKRSKNSTPINQNNDGMYSKMFNNSQLFNQLSNNNDFIDENMNGIDDREETIMANGGRIGKAEGGLMDLGGMEKDYRAEGGFVPIGEYEKKDDVPARLSVNEFVFTADAVRGAGQGDIDKGAEIMENMMENLENGGTVSEESQGNKGAQNMFKTSERLGAVI